MGLDDTFGLAFGKAQVAAGERLPEGGTVFLSLADRDKAAGLKAAARLVEQGFTSPPPWARPTTSSATASRSHSGWRRWRGRRDRRPRRRGGGTCPPRSTSYRPAGSGSS